jgi:hypothetical protein
MKEKLYKKTRILNKSIASFDQSLEVNLISYGIVLHHACMA